MRDPDELKPISFQQLCALLRGLLDAEPSMDDAEWKARAKDTLARWGFLLPAAEQLARAMSAVEQAMVKTRGPRPLPATPAVKRLPPPRRWDTGGPRERAGGWASVGSLVGAVMDRLRKRTHAA